MANDDLAFSYDLGTPGPAHAFLQWKGTDACFDFYCDCGAHCHFDGYFAYVVKCPHCLSEWKMPFNLFPRKLAQGSDAAKWHEPILMEADEDMTDAASDSAPEQALVPQEGEWWIVGSRSPSCCNEVAFCIRIGGDDASLQWVSAAHNGPLPLDWFVPLKKVDVDDV